MFCLQVKQTVVTVVINPSNALLHTVICECLFVSHWPTMGIQIKFCGRDEILQAGYLRLKHTQTENENSTKVYLLATKKIFYCLKHLFLLF